MQHKNDYDDDDDGDDDDDDENQKVVHRHWPHNNGSLGEFSLTSSGENDGGDGMDRYHDDDDGDDSFSCGGGKNWCYVLMITMIMMMDNKYIPPASLTQTT